MLQVNVDQKPPLVNSPIHTRGPVQARVAATVINASLTESPCPTRCTAACVRVKSIDTRCPIEACILDAVVDGDFTELTGVA